MHLFRSKDSQHLWHQSPIWKSRERQGKERSDCGFKWRKRKTGKKVNIQTFQFYYINHEDFKTSMFKWSFLYVPFNSAGVFCWLWPLFGSSLIDSELKKQNKAKQQIATTKTNEQTNEAERKKNKGNSSVHFNYLIPSFDICSILPEFTVYCFTVLYWNTRYTEEMGH